ncbi:DUF1493 family protein [Brenneria populi subsp. brevivirga]|uniref:DUF1493 family protein n=1 Tax=Brenneria populi TaxID=1505588 RepID=UPI002E1888E5|nr:DUF1493 family protein [Brenneria populi subsp. brevivirga]
MSIEQDVIELVDKYGGGPSLFSRIPPIITPDTELKKDLKLANEDALDLIMEYAEKFGVDTQDIPFTEYFPNEKGFFEMFTPKVMPKPLTVRMLIESAKAGKWLY